MHSEKILEISLLLLLRLRLPLRKRSGWLDPSQSANESPVPRGCPGAAPRPCAPVVVVVVVAVAVAVAMMSNDE